jgi:hypothetical protein
LNTPKATYFAWCAAIIAASLVFVVPAFTTVPLLWYYPVARRWALEGRPDGFALDWFGRTIWAMLAVAIAFPGALAVARRVRTPSPRTYLLWGAWAGMTSVLAIAVYTYQLANRHPVPEPLPASYQAR